MSVVLVTGGSGFIGSHCILQLLAAGHVVRTTVRHLKREAEVRALLKQGGAEPGEGLSFFAAELENDAGWAEAVQGCDYVLHVASPLPPHVPKNADELIVPAREGTLRVLRAARDAGVKRVVVTSSFTAIGYSHAPQKTMFNETSWTDPNAAGVLPYAKSKTLAERNGVGFRRPRRQRSRTRCRQPGDGVRSGSGARLLGLDSSGAAAAGRYPAARGSILASSTYATSRICICAP